MKKNYSIIHSSFLGMALLLAGLATTQAKSLVLPLEAIEDSATLRAKEFAEKNPGIDVSGYYPDDPGYYISYKHRNLTYYFGPADTYEEALEWKSKLDVVREDIVNQRPTLASHEVVIYNFSLEIIEDAKNDLKAGKGSDGSSSNANELLIGQPGAGEQGQGQDSGLLIPQVGADGQSIQLGQQQAQSGSQGGRKGSSSGQQGIQIIQSSGQGSSSSSSSSSSGRGSSSGSSSGESGSSSGGGGGSGGKPSWWQIIKGIFGG